MEIMPHLKLPVDLGIRYAILPGDPARVDRIAKFLESPRELAFNREYKSVGGSYKGVPILALSTGIGGPSTGIAVEELARMGVKAAIRIGSCGALQKNIHLGDLILVQGAVRDEGTSKTYLDPIYPAVPDYELLAACVEAAREKKFSAHVGLARSHDSFYTDREDEIDAYWSGQGILGADMETAALFVIGRLRGMKTASILNTVVEYEENLEENINSYSDGASLTMRGEEHEILTALEACCKIEQAE
ncbi:nucleoside phosphorylase [Anaerosacchariphilus sp. NSJ-68]|uniref:Uridine phosphorylase n=2 Tax=Lachnospiraceae TaxID=186803 RepID=A0A923LE68_9FIRM|nr:MULTISPECIES: nucleoside phosphorylase [Lachnospiraceae]MBC5660627.1 nucleoside phosphorylase [Anaerosacchariphilus hominis]MBC5699490.1 nucleoside phosphorylase [Roseburia difficilis]